MSSSIQTSPNDAGVNKNTGKMCVFCDIANGVIETKIIAQNNHAVVFADRAPRAPVHYLIVPRTHIININDLNDSHQDVTWAMLKLAQQVAAEQPEQAFRLVANNGARAGQVVFHMHWHFMAGVANE